MHLGGICWLNWKKASPNSSEDCLQSEAMLLMGTLVNAAIPFIIHTSQALESTEVFTSGWTDKQYGAS